MDADSQYSEAFLIDFATKDLADHMPALDPKETHPFQFTHWLHGCHEIYPSDHPLGG